jgi:hypothetical protein
MEISFMLSRFFKPALVHATHLRHMPAALLHFRAVLARRPVTRFARGASLVRPATSRLIKPSNQFIKLHAQPVTADFKSFSELTEEQIKKVTIKFSDTQPKITDGRDLFDFADRLLKKGVPGLSDIKDGKAYERFKSGWPAVPTELVSWFRGHSHPGRDLMPSVYRYQELPGNDHQLENPLVSTFLDNPNNNKNFSMAETLGIMQHYGYSTRFLDWSSSIWSAAYFACKEDKAHDHEDGLIWILNPIRLNMDSTLTGKITGLALKDYFDAEIRSVMAITDTYEELTEYSDVLLKSKIRPNISNYKDFMDFIEKCKTDPDLKSKMRYSIAAKIAYNIPRIAAQNGMFTIFGGKQYFDRDEINKSSHGDIFEAPKGLYQQAVEIQEKNKNPHSFLQCLRIDAAAKPIIREQLKYIVKVSEPTLMLDLDSQGRAATELFRFKRAK